MSESDTELDAMTAVASALKPLDRVAARRVLEWARSRYVDAPIEEPDLDFFGKFVNGARDAASQLGDISALDVTRALVAVKRAKDEASFQESSPDA